MDGNVEKIDMTATSTTELSEEKKGCKSGGHSSKNVFQQIQDAKKESDNSAKYAGKTAEILGSAYWITLMLPSLAGIPLAFLINGAIFFDRCPVEPMIPIYMIVSGSFSIVEIAIDYILRLTKRCQGRDPCDENNTIEKVFSGISSLIGVFLFAFFIAGNVWVFRVFTPNFDDIAAANYCHPTPYWFTFGVIISSYALAGLFLFVCCCCCCAAAFASKKGVESPLYTS